MDSRQRPDRPPTCVHAGVLVMLMEDEYDYVRLATLGAVSALSRVSPSLAAAGLNILQDSLADDSGSVRVAAAYAIGTVLRGTRPSEARVKALRAGLADSQAAVRLATAQYAPALGPRSQRTERTLHG